MGYVPRGIEVLSGDIGSPTSDRTFTRNLVVCIGMAVYLKQEGQVALGHFHPYTVRRRAAFDEWREFNDKFPTMKKGRTKIIIAQNRSPWANYKGEVLTLSEEEAAWMEEGMIKVFPGSEFVRARYADIGEFGVDVRQGIWETNLESGNL